MLSKRLPRGVHIPTIVYSHRTGQVCAARRGHCEIAGRVNDGTFVSCSVKPPGGLTIVPPRCVAHPIASANALRWLHYCDLRPSLTFGSKLPPGAGSTLPRWSTTSRMLDRYMSTFAPRSATYAPGCIASTARHGGKISATVPLRPCHEPGSRGRSRSSPSRAKQGGAGAQATKDVTGSLAGTTGKRAEAR